MDGRERMTPPRPRWIGQVPIEIDEHRSRDMAQVVGGSLRAIVE
jgi:hypothetical protein